MRNATKWLLVAAGLFAAAGVTQAADRAGVGLEWGIGPSIVFGNFDMKFDSAFQLSWKVSDDFALSVFTSQGRFSGSHEYTDNTVTPNIKHKIDVFGATDISGISVLHSIPMLSFLMVGLELGQANFGEDGASPTYPNSDGSTGSIADFGGARDAFSTDGALEGIIGKITVLHSESKTVTADVGITASLRFIQLQELRVFGTQESTTNITPRKAIDPVSSYNSLALQLGVTLGF